MIPKFLLKDQIVAKDGFHRWLVVPAALGIHMSIGSVYAWSVFNGPLSKLQGVVAQSPHDWSLGGNASMLGWGGVAFIFSLAIVFLGLSAAIGGKWLERVGPRCVGVTAALCWGGGFLVAAIGINLHNLWLVYLGYGVLGGCGLGLGYVSPVSTLIRWFPDRRGMAAGLAIMGFGGGAFLGAPMKEALLAHFSKPAQDVGIVSQLVEQGRLHTAAKGQPNEGARIATLDSGDQVMVVEARITLPGDVPGDMAIGTEMQVDGETFILTKKRHFESKESHAFVVGSGSTGAMQTFIALGIIYLLVMLAAAFAFRVPHDKWLPVGFDPEAAKVKAAQKMASSNHVHIDTALRTPQFWLLWLVLCLNVTAGIGVLGVAKTMMKEMFNPSFPTLVTTSFAATFVMMLSIFNMLGRFFWASSSDWLGRKNTYNVYFILGMICYGSLPFIIGRAVMTEQALYVWVFYGVAMIIISMYGGGFATIPAYLADIFSTKYVGGIHGRLLTAWSTAGILGPWIITSMRQRVERPAIRELVNKLSESQFQAAYGTGKDQLATLISQKTVTIPNLMENLRQLGIDAANPSGSLYNGALFVMTALLGVALVANLLVRPVHEKYHLKDDEEQ